MKGIKKTLVTGFLACSALQAQAGPNPWGAGVKAGYQATWASVDEKTVKIDGKDPKNPLSHCANGGLYGEYAFCDYVGGQLAAFYARKNASLKKDGVDKAALTVQSHGITVPLSCYVYPLGREAEEGMLNFHFGVHAFLPLSTKLAKEGQEVKNLTDDQQKEVPKWDGGGHAGAGWEFPFGLTVEARYHMNFRNRFTLEKDKEQTIFRNVSGLKKLQENDLTVNVGYNLASLFTA